QCRTKSADQDERLEERRAACDRGRPRNEKEWRDAQRVSEELLEELNARDRYEAKGDLHSVDAMAREAAEAFKEAMAQQAAEEAAAKAAGRTAGKDTDGPPLQLADKDVVEILEQQARILASISHNVMFAVDAVGTRNADRVFARDVAERVNKPERPARAHPLMSLYNLATRCTRS